MIEPQTSKELTVGKHTSVALINEASFGKEEMNVKWPSMGVSVCLPI